MADTSIEWASKTWNPTTGCSRVSTGCNNCYAMHFARRFDGQGKGYDGTTRRGKNGTDWTGVVLEHPARLGEPLKWRNPERVFVDSMSDLFHPTVSQDFLDAVFGVMGLARWQTFMILTKRPERMRDYVLGLRERSEGRYFIPALLENAACQMRKLGCDLKLVDEFFAAANRHAGVDTFPLPNVWLGTSVENQVAAKTRVPALIETPAAVRFLSCEPLLGPVELDPWLKVCKHWQSEDSLRTAPWHPPYPKHWYEPQALVLAGWESPIHWVITGGESGNGARPMDPDWARSLRDQCAAAKIAFFHKQNGEWLRSGPEYEDDGMAGGVAVHHPFGSHIRTATCIFTEDGKDQRRLGPDVNMERVGKKRAGRLLDGREHNDFPKVEQ